MIKDQSLQCDDEISEKNQPGSCHRFRSRFSLAVVYSTGLLGKETPWLEGRKLASDYQDLAAAAAAGIKPHNYSTIILIVRNIHILFS